MATYVLVHGGGHGGWCWQRLAPLLRAAGHEVYTPTLTGLGERAHLVTSDTDLDTHITDVVAVLTYEDLHDAILVGHSYGGMVITGVADRAPSRVAHLVYLDAARPRDGQALTDLAPGLMTATRKTARVVDGVELVLFPGTSPLPHFGVTDPEWIAWMTPKLTPQPWKSFSQPLRLSDQSAVDRIPRSAINTAATMRGRPADNRDRALDAENVWEIDTGHDLMITEPRAVADLLLRLVPAEQGTPTR